MIPSEFFLKTTFQKALEDANYFFHLPSPETQPFNNKYQARSILENLLKEQALNLDNCMSCKLRAIVFFLLGINYNECEENSQSENYLKKSLDLFSILPDNQIHTCYNYLQELYNMLGLIHINRDENEIGLSLIAKSQDLYKQIKSSKYPFLFIVNNSKNYFKRLKEGAKDVIFQYYYEGGVSLHKTEGLYTHSLFYLAQAYTKLGFKESAAHYCGLTMKRQFETQTFELKDFCINCISLAEYYQGNKNFRQAQYLLMAANSILPQNRKKKLHATMSMSLGRMFLDYLKTSVKIIQDNIEEPSLLEVFNKMYVQFEGIKLEITEIKILKDIEEVKCIFRTSYTQYKLALQYFVLDGFVTENTQILFDVIELYKQLGSIEKDKARYFGMLEKRTELLVPLYKEINQKAYQALYEKILVSLAELNNEMFELKFQQLFVESEKIPKQQKIQQMNQYGENSIKMYSQIAEILINDKEAAKDGNYFHSVVNAKFNVAKALSKVYLQTKEERITTLKNSIDIYKWIANYIKNEIVQKGVIEYTFDQELSMSKEMVELLSAKIDKINSEK